MLQSFYTSIRHFQLDKMNLAPNQVIEKLMDNLSSKVVGTLYFNNDFQLFVSLVPPLPIFLSYNKLPMTKKDLARKILRGQEITVRENFLLYFMSCIFLINKSSIALSKPDYIKD